MNGRSLSFVAGIVATVGVYLALGTVTLGTYEVDTGDLVVKMNGTAKFTPAANCTVDNTSDAITFVCHD